MSSPDASRRRRRLAIVAGLSAAAAGLGVAAGWWRLQGREADAGAVDLLLGQTLPDPAGEPFRLDRFAGRPLVVNFWATWCTPCVEEMPELSALHDELSPKGVSLVGIGIDSAAKIASFARNFPVSYPLVVAGMGGTELARQLGNSVGALPFTVVIDRRRQVVYRVLGRVDIARLRSVARDVAG